MADKGLAQTYYEEAEALKASGMSNADAVRQVAETHGKAEPAVRSGIHQYKTKHLGQSSSTGRRSRAAQPATFDTAVASARRTLEDAVDLIDREVETAKVERDAAQQRYDSLVAAADERKRMLAEWINGMS